MYRINQDFTPGEEVKQPGPIDAGIFAHQVRVTPDNRLAILVTRGNEGTPTKAEDPGALKVFDYKNGVLTNEVSIAPDGGRDFGPRHLDFHPTKPWMYVSIETQNKMYTYKMEAGRINPEIAFRAETLAEPKNIRARQAAGTVHVHPNGRFLYGANRAQDTVEFQGKKVFKGGENSIVVYSIDQSTGEPSPIQHIETRAIHPRTFHIDPSGRMLVAQHNLPVDVRDGDAVRTIPAGLSVLRIGDDGKLTFVAQVRHRRRRQDHVLDGHGPTVAVEPRVEYGHAVQQQHFDFLWGTTMFRATIPFAVGLCANVLIGLPAMAQAPAALSSTERLHKKPFAYLPTSLR